MPISCHFRDCKALLFKSTHASSAIASTQTFTLTFVVMCIFLVLGTAGWRKKTACTPAGWRRNAGRVSTILATYRLRNDRSSTQLHHHPTSSAATAFISSVLVKQSPTNCELYSYTCRVGQKVV